MLPKADDVVEELRQVWKEEIELLERLQLGEAEQTEPTISLSETLAELLALQRAATALQDRWQQRFDSLSAEMLQLKERKRQALAGAIAWVRTTEQQIIIQKRDVLEQLSDVNRSQAGYNRYNKR